MVCLQGRMGKNVINREMSDGSPVILFFPARQPLSSLTAPSTRSLQRALLSSSLFHL